MNPNRFLITPKKQPKKSKRISPSRSRESPSLVKAKVLRDQFIKRHSYIDETIDDDEPQQTPLTPSPTIAKRKRLADEDEIVDEGEDNESDHVTPKSVDTLKVSPNISSKLGAAETSPAPARSSKVHVVVPISTSPYSKGKNGRSPKLHRNIFFDDTKRDYSLNELTVLIKKKHSGRAQHQSPSMFSLNECTVLDRMETGLLLVRHTGTNVLHLLTQKTVSQISPESESIPLSPALCSVLCEAEREHEERVFIH
ncbi:hypothetical protein SJAG_01849 [Schizosaccharomyces japonicus yFS275]|uniref:Uncharacterized protein n=1 Tax=Schizosaccharomyces japonicus (strain yFS275 / FY16936) TaxID=402676 RepID=B6JZ26_SCHJY|nr:hypothetical protein SJAG_01849 [Schizosaccharomyces japonicus yFS275]EEB06794.1 hypothetical protein SJAG_01849 [Schizosaccharomyces japonicus yFS275]